MPIQFCGHSVSFMGSMFRMSLVARSITGVPLGLIMIILICLLLGFPWRAIYQVTPSRIFTAPVIIFFESFSFLSSSSAAPPARLNSFIVETNGGTGGANTCTLLFP